MTRVREATLDDLDAVYAMGDQFLRETTYAAFMQPNAEPLLASIVSFIDVPDRLGLVAERDGRVVGMIALLVAPHPFSGERTAFEVVWWVTPAARGLGVRLLRAAEQWARDQGTVAMQMVAPNARVGAFYARVGYVPVETAYQRTWAKD
jgi:GNAT superfamily N-acetyltransferase